VKPAAEAARRRDSHAHDATSVDPSPYGHGRDPRAVGDEMKAVFDRDGWTERVEVASIAARWRDIVGGDIADHGEVMTFDEGTLVIRATSTAWADQLSTMSGHLRQRVNEEVGRDIISEVRVLGPLTRSWVKGPRTVKGRGPRDTYG
jgi:predicted nucleic acid-binding Zn ribbon protein